MTSLIAFLKSTGLLAAIRPYRQALLKVRSHLKRVGSGEQIAKTDLTSGIRIQRCGDFEVVIREKTADEEVLQESFDKDIFFAGVPQYVPREDDLIIDVGAHIGTFSLLASSRVPHGRVFAIEASLDTYTLLRINIALNRRDNIRACHLALMDHNGTAKLSHDRGNWGHSTVAILSTSSEDVRAESLSAFLDRNEIDRCDFMKMNCEGSEFPILLGATHATLSRFQRILVLYHCDLWKSNSLTDLISHLENAGFAVEIRGASSQRGWLICSAPSAQAEPIKLDQANP
jgi:FkbM family methyltransferase